MEDASLLYVGAEAERDLVEVPPQDCAAPDGGAVVDGNSERTKPAFHLPLRLGTFASKSAPG